MFGVILVIVGWLEFAYAKLMRFKRESRENWMKIESMLKARAASILTLLEEIHEEGILEPEMEAIFDLGGGLCQSEDRDQIAEQSEKVTPLLYSLFEKLNRKGSHSVAVEEIKEMDLELVNMSRRFNESIQAHNDIIRLKKYKFQIMILRPEVLRDFQINRQMQ